MIDVICANCGQGLNEPGGLMFSPPMVDGDGLVVKLHLCVDCYKGTGVGLVWRKFIEYVIEAPWADETVRQMARDALVGKSDWQK